MLLGIHEDYNPAAHCSLATCQAVVTASAAAAAAAAAATSWQGKAGFESDAAARGDEKRRRSEALRAAHLGRIRARAGDEGKKVEEVTFINTLNHQGRQADLHNKLQHGA